MYGGRIIDNYDRRVSKIYMDEYFGDFLFDSFQPFHFYRDDSVDYAIPHLDQRDEYIDYIEQLPLVNSPEVFGLHPNAEIGYFTQTTKEMWSNLIKLQPQTGKEFFFQSVQKYFYMVLNVIELYCTTKAGLVETRKYIIKAV